MSILFLLSLLSLLCRIVGLTGTWVSNCRFAKEVTVLEPTLYNVASYYFQKDPTKILGLRIDTLSQMANLANLRPGGRFLVVDTTGGLLVGAALDRLGGDDPFFSSIYRPDHGLNI